MIRTIVFDADNTLYKSKEAATVSDSIVFKEIAKKTKKSEKEIYDIFWDKIIPLVKNMTIPYYRSRRYGYSLLLKELKIFDANLAEELYQKFKKKELEVLELYTEVKEVLTQLNAAGYRLILFTEEESELLDDKIKQLNLGGYFSKLITSTNIGMMKAGEGAYQELIRKTGIKPSESIMVGDSISNDILPASEQGFMTILIDRKNEKQKGKADYEIRNLREIIQILEEN
ncbi:MAG: HAD family hydrolase [Candidatus Nanoarchaeia archaeon]|nr:HAD family hydrolase [Candidatus Nanoarchaeia archaeon]